MRRPVRLWPIPILCAVAGNAVTAQSTFVVPAKASYRSEGNWHDALLFPAGGPAFRPSHVQVVYDNLGISVPSATVRGLALRRAASSRDDNLSTNVEWVVRMANSGRTSADASAVFADNLGTHATTVFSGRMRLPTRISTPWPAPFENPIPLTTPFSFSKLLGNSLVVDMVVLANSHNRPWLVESSVIEYGSHQVELVQPLCLHSGNGASTEYQTAEFQPVPGGPFQLRLPGMPAQSATMAGSRLFFGVQGAGGSLGGLPLPFELAAVGLAASPGCRWAIDLISDAPMSYDPSGRLEVAFRMPDDPIMAEGSFYTQALCVDLDPTTSALRLYPSIAVKWTVGFGKLPPATMITRVDDTTPPQPTGVVSRGQAIVLQLTQ